MDIKELAQKFIEAHKEAWEKGTFEKLEKLEDPGIVQHSVPRGQDTVVGWEAHKKHIEQARQTLLSLDWQYLTGEGNHFALSYRLRATVNSTTPGAHPPDAKEVRYDYLYVFHVSGGKIDRIWYAGTTTYT